MPAYGTVDRDYAIRMATWPEDDDGPVHLLNLMKYKARADYGDGGSEVSGREADDRYAPTDVLADIGAAVCFFADVVASSEDWDRVAVVRYPSRRAFIEMQRRKDFQEKHVHKEAGMDHTIVLVTRPMGGLPPEGERIVLDVWDGDAPPGDGSDFVVEGAIIGDGRAWAGARYRAADGEVDGVDTTTAGPTHQRLVLAPAIQRWG